MNITVTTPDAPLPTERAYALSMTIKAFKGRRDVEVHLFRHCWDPAEESGLDFDSLLGDPIPDAPVAPEQSKSVILEAFTAEERDTVIDFLKTQYATRLSAISSRPLDFPVPKGLPALSAFQEGKNVGLIRFERIPSYSLDVNLRGLYDLSQHPPIVEGVG